jgi:transposase-like protein
MGRANVTYSEAFKRQVIEELERGKFASIYEASRAYGIKGSITINRWVQKYGHRDLLPKRVRIETLKERDELKDARKRIRELGGIYQSLEVTGMKNNQLKSINAIILYIIIVFCLFVIDNKSEESRSSVTQDEINQITDFFNFIKANGSSWDPNKFISFVSPYGVTFSDINNPQPDKCYNIQQIKDSLSKHNGTVYKTIYHLSEIYSTPSPQYSELNFRKKDNNVEAHVGDWYVLTFKLEKGRCLLIKCEYIMFEGG